MTRQALTRNDTGAIVPCETEADIYEAIDVPYVPPELRHGQYEFALAHDGWLDDLVTLDDMRGDLHVHTLWSDGRDSSEAVLRAIRKLGYEYVAITDHSETSKATRTLSVERMRQQMAEIQGLRTRFSGHHHPAGRGGRDPAGRPARLSRRSAGATWTSCSPRCTSRTDRRRRSCSSATSRR